MIEKSKTYILEDWEVNFIKDSLTKQAKNQEEFDLIKLFNAWNRLELTVAKVTVTNERYRSKPTT